MPRTLAWRLAARYLLLLAALLALSAGFQYVALRRILLTAATDTLLAAARRPVASYHAAVTAGVPLPAAVANLLRAVQGPRTRASIRGAPAPGPSPGPASTAAPAPPPRARPVSLRPLRPSSVRVRSGALRVVVPVGPSGAGRAVELVLSTPLEGPLAVLGEEVRLLVVGGAAALALGGASGALAVRQALRPLRAITGVAGRIAAGDLGVRAGQADAPEEVARLAGAFDAMVDRLAAAIGEERDTHRQMRQLLDDASHELRTPLTALTGTLEVLQGDAGDDPGSVREGLRAAYRQARRMGSLVAGLLALARAERPDALPLRPTDLRAVLAAVRPAAERLAADHRLEWADPGPELPVDADSEALGGALLAVVENAVRYSPLGAPIQVQALRAPEAAEVRVTDRGPGIPAECLPRVFDRFYRCPPAPGAPAPPGTGLGLAIVHSVMERHHGEAAIESAAGHGTIVRLRLPLRQARASAAPGAAPL